MIPSSPLGGRLGPRPLGRRRVITLLAAAGAMLQPTAGLARAPLSCLWRWRGPVMGAEASILLFHPDRDAAAAIIGRCLAEVRRLERSLSLFLSDSALVRLNRDGRLTLPPAEVVALLRAAEGLSQATDGAFDVTVQPVWRLYQEHFQTDGADPAGPDAAAVAAAAHLVDYRAVAVDGTAVVLGRPGMMVTLNGIAQGYITDRVADLLRANGADCVLLNLGEIRALGAAGPDGAPWRIGIDGSDAVLPVMDRAVATSAAQGTVFDPGARFGHLFDPRTGRCVARYRSVTVVAPRATVADGLSTGLSVVTLDEAAVLLRRFPGVVAHFVLRDGRRTSIGGVA